MAAVEEGAAAAEGPARDRRIGSRRWTGRLRKRGGAPPADACARAATPASDAPAATPSATRPARAALVMGRVAIVPRVSRVTPKLGLGEFSATFCDKPSQNLHHRAARGMLAATLVLLGLLPRLPVHAPTHRARLAVRTRIPICSDFDECDVDDARCAGEVAGEQASRICARAAPQRATHRKCTPASSHAGAASRAVRTCRARRALLADSPKTLHAVRRSRRRARRCDQRRGAKRGRNRR